MTAAAFLAHRMSHHASRPRAGHFRAVEDRTTSAPSSRHPLPQNGATAAGRVDEARSDLHSQGPRKVWRDGEGWFVKWNGRRIYDPRLRPFEGKNVRVRELPDGRIEVVDFGQVPFRGGS